MPCSRAIIPIFRIGWTVPVTLLAWVTAISRVSGRIAAGDCLGIDQPAGRIDHDAGLFDAAGIRQGIERAEDRIVIDLRADRMTFDVRMEKPLDGQVQGIGAIERENKMVAVFTMEKPVEPAAAFGEQRAGLDGLAIRAAAGAGAEIGGVADHRFQNLLGLGEAGGGVVEI